jgi:hypothetical protein
VSLPPSGERLLAGNGVALVRERALAADVQGALERVYRLDRVADVGDFVGGTEDGARESVLLRHAADGALELQVRLPPVDDRARFDGVCQIIEGVSHFVYLVERSRAERVATQLELEVQAEVDKWLLLAASLARLDVARSRALRARLYEHVTFSHEADTEVGDRYRVANDVAHSFVRRIERQYVGAARFPEMRDAMRRFFQGGQEEKLRLARAA